MQGVVVFTTTSRPDRDDGDDYEHEEDERDQRADDDADELFAGARLGRVGAVLGMQRSTWIGR